MKSRIVKSAVVLTVGMLVSKAIGVLYRIPLSNMLGAEGIGLYQLVFSVYALIVTVIGSGLPIAVSRLTAENVKEDKSVLYSSLILGLTSGVIISVGLLFLSTTLAKLQGNRVAWSGYVAICPAVFFVAGLSVLKGYFQGKVNMLPTSISYLLEQVVKLAVGLGLAYYFAPYGIVKQVVGSLVGVTVSEAVSFVVLLVIYYVKRDVKTRVNHAKTREISSRLVKIAFPVTVGSTLVPLSQFIDSFIVVNLIAKTKGQAYATAMYGLFSGSVNPIVNMPIMLVLSLAMIIVPVVSKERVNLNYYGILEKSKSAIKFCFVFGLPFTVLLAVFSTPILSVVYPRFSQNEIETAASLLSISSLSIVFYGVMQVETSLMQGLDRIYIPVKNILFALVVKEILCVILVNKIGILGLAYSTLSMSVIACVLNNYNYRKLLGTSFDLGGELVKTIVISAIFFILSLISKIYISNNISGFLVACLGGGSIYYILLKRNEVLSESELKSVGLFEKTINLRKEFYRRKI